MKEIIQLWHNHQESWFKIATVNLDHLKDHEVMVNSSHSLVSTGTERLVLTSKLDPITRERMAFPLMKGSFDADFTYGYSLTGVIEHGPSDLLGKCVHMLHPHQSAAQVSMDDVTLIPERFLKKGVFISNLETVINALWDANLSLGDTVLIIGYGTIGSLLLQIVRHMPGITVQVMDKDEDKEKLAAPYIKGDASGSYDVVFHTTASSEGLQYGIDHLRKEGKLIEMSWFGSQKAEVSLGASFHYDRKTIISSQVSSIPHGKTANWNFEKRKQLAISFLDMIDIDQLIQQEIPFSASAKFFNKLRKSEINKSGTLITY